MPLRSRLLYLTQCSNVTSKERPAVVVAGSLPIQFQHTPYVVQVSVLVRNESE